MGNSLLAGAAQIGMDVRLGAPKACWPEDHLVRQCRRSQPDRCEDRPDRRSLRGRQRLRFRLHRCVGVNGEPDSVWKERIELLTPYRVTAGIMAATGNPHAKFMHCLPAFHNRETEVGEKIFQQYGIDSMEVTEEVFESEASIVFDRRKTECTRSRPCWSQPWGRDMRVVIALGGNALLKRGEPMTADAQRTNVRKAAAAMADLARDHDIVVAHGNGPQVGLLALQAAAYKDVDPYPLDVLGAESVGMIGYLVEQELTNAMPAGSGSRHC